MGGRSLHDRHNLPSHILIQSSARVMNQSLREPAVIVGSHNTMSDGRAKLSDIAQFGAHCENRILAQSPSRPPGIGRDRIDPTLVLSRKIRRIQFPERLRRQCRTCVAATGRFYGALIPVRGERVDALRTGMAKFIKNICLPFANSLPSAVSAPPPLALTWQYPHGLPVWVA